MLFYFITRQESDQNALCCDDNISLSPYIVFEMLFCRNRAIADYLRSNGYEEAYSVFKKEAELDVVSSNKILHLYFSSENPFEI